MLYFLKIAAFIYKMRGFPEYCIYFGFFYEKKENRPDY